MNTDSIAFSRSDIVVKENISVPYLYLEKKCEFLTKAGRSMGEL